MTKKSKQLKVDKETAPLSWWSVRPNFVPGVYLFGAGIFGGRIRPRLETYDVTDVLTLEERDLREDKAEATMVCGPFSLPSSTSTRTVLVTVANAVESSSSPETFATIFSCSSKRTGTVQMVPPATYLRSFCDENGAAVEGAVRGGKGRLRSVLESLEARERTIASYASSVRRVEHGETVLASVLENVFFFGMYARRWCGPGRPYPIADEQTRKKVGTRSNPCSEDLRGRYVRVCCSTREDMVCEVKVYDRDVGDEDEGLPSDAANGEGRLGHMEACHFACALRGVDWLRNNVRDATPECGLLACMERALDWDGNAWPLDPGVETLPLILSRLQDRSDSRSCIRRSSMHLIRTSRYLWRAAFPSSPVPEWARASEWIPAIDVTGR